MNFNFEFFTGMTNAEAEAWQRDFLAQEHDAWREFGAELERSGVRADFTLASIDPVLTSLAVRLRTRPLPDDRSIPAEIRAHPTYEYARFDFDEPSRVLILRAGYYFGECLIRAHPQLHWGIGRSGTALQGQPSVVGFTNSDLSVLLVVRNLFKRFIVDGRREFAQTAESWQSFVPGRAESA